MHPTETTELGRGVPYRLLIKLPFTSRPVTYWLERGIECFDCIVHCFIYLFIYLSISHTFQSLCTPLTSVITCHHSHISGHTELGIADMPRITKSGHTMSGRWVLWGCVSLSTWCW